MARRVAPRQPATAPSGSPPLVATAARGRGRWKSKGTAASLTQRSLQPATPSRGVPCGQRRRKKTAKWLEGLGKDPGIGQTEQLRTVATAAPPLPAVVRPPPREGMKSGSLVWARLPRWGWWPARLWRARFTRRREEILRERRPLSRLVALMGDNTFAWCTDDQLEPLEPSAPECLARLTAFRAYGDRQKNATAAAQVARALAELAFYEGSEAPCTPWPSGSLSSGDEGASEDESPTGEAVDEARASASGSAATVTCALLQTPDLVSFLVCRVPARPHGGLRVQLRSPRLRALRQGRKASAGKMASRPTVSVLPPSSSQLLCHLDLAASADRPSFSLPPHHCRDR